MAEIQFESQGIKTDRQKYQRTLASISPEISDEILDLLENPPRENQYQVLKEALLERLTMSDEQKLETLLKGRDIGDKRPSEALRYIKNLAGIDFSEKVIKSLWIRKIPETIRIALLAQPNAIASADLAKTADRMYESLNSEQRQISAVNRPSRPKERSILNYEENRRSPTSSFTVADRLTRIESILNNIRFYDRSQSRGRGFASRSLSRTSSNPNRPGNSRRKQNVCWYHVTYGKNARTYRQPCKFTRAKSTSHMDIEQSKND